MNVLIADYNLANSDGGVDRTWYLQTYPDVAAAGVDPVEHYLQEGWREGRDPRPDFSTSGYLDANKDSEGNPLVHYLRHGGTKVPPPEWLFTADYHLASGDCGLDRTWYLQTYPDVARAGVDPIEHYLRHGWHEGRDPRPDFSTSGYLRINKDVEGNPLVHYLRRMREARAGEATVSDWYLLWEKGCLYPKGGQELPANAAFGSQGVPKILFTGHEASRSGAPLILLRLMEALQNLTHAELYLILERDGPLLADYQRIAHVLVNGNGMLYLPNGPDLTRMLESIAGPGPRLAICNCADGWRLVNALRSAGLPHIVSLLHERVIHYPPDVWRSIHRNSDCLILPAAAVKAATTAVLPEFQDAFVVPQGLLNPEFGHGDKDAARTALRNKLGLSPDTALVLGCGNKDMRKGIDLFVQLAARVRTRTSRDVHFLWLGGEQTNDSLFSRLVELDIRLLNLTPTVSLLGEVTDTEPYFLAADAFVLTSRDDPFPCVIHEAMACALPIVVFDGSGGAKEAISGGCGIVVPYLDIAAMAGALTSVVEDPMPYAAMGQRAELRVRSVYRFSEYAERIKQICDVILDERTRQEAYDVRGSITQIAQGLFLSKQKPREAARDGNPIADMKNWLQGVGRTIRIEQWWSHKLVPMFAVFYATVYIHQNSIAAVWPAAVALLLAVASCAAYVSLVNDVTDRADDSRADKSNRMAGKPAWEMALLLAEPLCVALIFSILWIDDIPLVAAYLGAWAAFSLYSIPPFRLKRRGVLGVIADACGSHVFPTLTATLLAQRAFGFRIDPVWIGALTLWALGCGLRGILWHQLYDFEADRKADVQTFVLRHSRLSALRLARVALLIEIVGLAVMLWKIGSPWPVVFLSIYAAFAMLKSRIWNVAIVIAEPRDRYAILGQEYYTVLFPLGILLSSALHYRADWTIVIAHFIVFSKPAVSLIRETRLLAQSSLGSDRSPGRGKATMGDDAPQAHPVRSNSDRRDERSMTTPTNAGAATLDAAIAKAATFLRERLRSGSYGLACVGSDGAPRFSNDKGHVFVASFIAEAMTGLFDEIDRTIVIVRILSEENQGVWGFSPPGPRHSDETNVFHVDSDDSAYVIRTLQLLGVNRPPQCLMRFYREPERLFVTFDAPGPTSLTTENSPRNNLLAHPEVNANVFLALRGTHFEHFVNYDMLLEAQDERGFWKSYFYPSPLYATLLVLEVTRGNPAFASSTERALSFIVGSQNADGSWGADSDPCATALAVAMLAEHQAHAAATRRGVEHLLSTMAEDGSWTSGACVWEFHANEHDVWRAYDTHRAFVTARCMTALRRAAGLLTPP
jgi:glycosyltransferase involved in cell wall biosynthesis/1,4-dihydroxy-2-naphthoate octaprenyltransferase